MGEMLTENLLKKSELSILKKYLINSHLIFEMECLVLKRIWDNFVVFNKKCMVSFPMAAFYTGLRPAQLYTANPHIALLCGVL